MIRVPLREGRTLHHDVEGRHGAGKVLLRAAPAGTGIIAGGPMRAVFETLGVQDVVAKSLGTSNPYNMVRATFDALTREDSPRSVAARRGLKVSVLQSRRRDNTDEVIRLPPRLDLGGSGSQLKEGRFHGEHRKDCYGRTDRQPAAPSEGPARDAHRSRPEQDAPPCDTEGHSGSARHDQ
jgi:hypothetical protein